MCFFKSARLKKGAGWVLGRGKKMKVLDQMFGWHVQAAGSAHASQYEDRTEGGSGQRGRGRPGILVWVLRAEHAIGGSGEGRTHPRI